MEESKTLESYETREKIKEQFREKAKPAVMDRELTDEEILRAKLAEQKSRPKAEEIPLDALRAILFLADQLAMLDEGDRPRSERVLSTLADELGIPNFRHQPWYHNFTETSALAKLSRPPFHKAALTTWALVLKTDLKGRNSGRHIFSRWRESIGANPVNVPVELEIHMRKVRSFFRPIRNTG
ncbi:MAG: hypothetical protein OEZ59_01250 [Deltaproteobacteria bacterium]|nr:hypothetical protein [Deltaproteobacteria bacterium]